MNRIGRQDSMRRAETRISKKTVNYVTLAILAPLLIVVGVAGFLMPGSLSLTSGAVPYDVFHIVFGTIGLLVLWDVVRLENSRRPPTIVSRTLPS